MILCGCVAKHEQTVREGAEEYLNGIHTVTPEVVLDFHRRLGDEKPCKKRCGQCLPAVADTLAEEASKQNVKVLCESKSRNELIALFKVNNLEK